MDRLSNYISSQYCKETDFLRTGADPTVIRSAIFSAFHTSCLILAGPLERIVRPADPRDDDIKEQNIMDNGRSLSN